MFKNHVNCNNLYFEDQKYFEPYKYFDPKKYFKSQKYFESQKDESQKYLTESCRLSSLSRELILVVRFCQYVSDCLNLDQLHPTLKASRQKDKKRISGPKKITSNLLKTDPTCSLQCSCCQFVCFCSLYLLFYHILMEKKRKKGQSLSLLYCSILYRPVGPERPRGNLLRFWSEQKRNLL